MDNSESEKIKEHVEENDKTSIQQSRTECATQSVDKVQVESTIDPTSVSVLARSARFKKLSNSIFDSIDVDKSGTVDRHELYAGLLLIHLRLARYAGGAACKPASLETVNTIFDKLDADKNGCLDREEFLQVMMVLCSNVVGRIAFLYGMGIFMLPLLSQCVVSIFGLVLSIGNFLVFTRLEGVINFFARAMYDFAMAYVVPVPFKKLGGVIFSLVSSVPDSTWTFVFRTFVSCSIGFAVIPYVLLNLDTYIDNLADQKSLNQQRLRVSNQGKNH